MTRKNILTTLALAEHARGISALSPELAGFFETFMATLPPHHQKLVRDYHAVFADIAKSGAEYLEEKAKS